MAIARGYNIDHFILMNALYRVIMNVFDSYLLKIA